MTLCTCRNLPLVFDKYIIYFAVLCVFCFRHYFRDVEFVDRPAWGLNEVVMARFKIPFVYFHGGPEKKHQ